MVSDGLLATSPSTMLFPQTPLAEIEAGLAAAHLPADPITLQVNAMVVNTGKNLALIDTGCGPKFAPTAGRLAAQLRAAGFAPEAIDTVIITHAHPDHLWGAVDDGWAVARFPNAAIYLGEVEHDFWADPGLSARMPEAFRSMVDGTQAVLKAVAPRLQLVQPGTEIVPGITSISTPGHTPGHLSMRLSSGSDQLVFSADVAHQANLQLANPQWHFGFDNDPAMAVETRKKTLDMLANDGVAGGRLSLPLAGDRLCRAGGRRLSLGAGAVAVAVAP